MASGSGRTGPGLALLMVRALQFEAWSPAALIAAALFGLFLWQGGTFFKRNRPGRYRPDAVPGDLVPPG